MLFLSDLFANHLQISDFSQKQYPSPVGNWQKCLKNNKSVGAHWLIQVDFEAFNQPLYIYIEYQIFCKQYVLILALCVLGESKALASSVYHHTFQGRCIGFAITTLGSRHGKINVLLLIANFRWRCTLASLYTHSERLFNQSHCVHNAI